MSDSQSTEVIRATQPQDVLAAIPVLLGFHPTASLVGLALTESSSRVALTVRLDIGPPGATARAMVRALSSARPESVLLVGYPEEVGTSAQAEVHEALRAIRAEGETRGWSVLDLLVVAGGRWWSLLCQEECSDGDCCSAERQPLRTEESPILAEAVYGGAVVHASREQRGELLRLVVDEQEALAASRAVQTAGSPEPDESPEVAWGSVGSWLSSAQRGEPELSITQAARVALALRRGDIRDRCYMQIADGDAEAWVDVWTRVLQRVAGSLRSGPAAMVAMASYLAGDGALANMAVATAREHDPSHPGARLVADLMSHLVPPTTVRDVLHDLARTPDE